MAIILYCTFGGVRVKNENETASRILTNLPDWIFPVYLIHHLPHLQNHDEELLYLIVLTDRKLGRYNGIKMKIKPRGEHKRRNVIFEKCIKVSIPFLDEGADLKQYAIRSLLRTDNKSLAVIDDQRRIIWTTTWNDKIKSAMEDIVSGGVYWSALYKKENEELKVMKI